MVVLIFCRVLEVIRVLEVTYLGEDTLQVT